MQYIQIIIASIALVISFFSLFLHYRKPRLKIEYDDKSPFKKLAMDLDSKKSYPIELFFRVKILNSKFVLAKNVTCKITRWYTNSKLVKEFDPIKLHWVSNEPKDFSSIDLSKDEFEYVDVLRTKRDLSKIQIYTNTHPRATPIEFNQKDEHIFKLSVYCNNGDSIASWFKIVYQEKDKNEELAWLSMGKIEKSVINNLVNT